MKNFSSLGVQALLPLCSVALVGTYNSDKTANVMTANKIGIVCVQPPIISLSLSHESLTCKNILEQKAFTLNIPYSGQVAKVDYAGIQSGKKNDKCKELELTPLAGEHVNAPYIEECPYLLELSVISWQNFGSHICFFGEVMDVKIKQNLLNEQGILLTDKLRLLSFSPLTRDYYEMSTPLGRAFSLGKTLSYK